MGSNDPKSDSNQRPAHRVEVSPFEMDVTEVTVADFRACAEAGACKATSTIETSGGLSVDARRAYEPSCNAGQAGRDIHPMNCVDWTQASAYCRWAGKRLPTEEEWEFAARGTEGRLYPWGDAAPDEALVNACDPSCVNLMVSRGQAWRSEFTRDDGFPETAPVGSFPAGRSPFGLFDMAGNVSEWTSSEYCSYMDGRCSAERRAIRGHSWLDDYPRWFSGTARTAAVPSFRHSNLGFRCAR
jgi:formylglycine-generating enzyme required for sulfatase activity